MRLTLHNPVFHFNIPLKDKFTFFSSVLKE